MAVKDHLAVAFLTRVMPSFELDSDRLQELLVACTETALESWPSFSISSESFAAYIAERVTCVAELESIRAADLYLACACAHGDAAAIRAFEEDVLKKTRGALARMDKQGDLVEEIQQIMRIELLVGSEQQPPRIVDYLGQGSLSGWTKVAATRRALKSFRKNKREVALQEWDLADGINDGVLDNLRSIYQREFRTAFETAFKKLSSEERNLLRLHIIDELAIDAIAKLFTIHRATAARRLGAARTALAEGTKQALTDIVGLEEEGLDSILGLVRSRLDLSLRRILDSPDKSSD